MRDDSCILINYLVDYIDNADITEICVLKKTLAIGLVLSIINKMGPGETHKLWLYSFCLISWIILAL